MAEPGLITRDRVPGCGYGPGEARRCGYPGGDVAGGC